MCGAVGRVFVLGGLVSLTGWDPAVHEPERRGGGGGGGDDRGMSTGEESGITVLVNNYSAESVNGMCLFVCVCVCMCAGLCVSDSHSSRI